ncbi:glutathione peroxidase [Xylophilus sp. GOD-11R]|uniref:glutathione peroxidase n=1 Tax=Xylophilus sp. GOD-11R TaxID=3089814 RepID=UPI00298D3A8D|nr:glutathione peroxidase [Xylophilus sp. GOD-11R]WPB56671.1 glutathione peroxidase [Xylophilus sp. GOD-11R]
MPNLQDIPLSRIDGSPSRLADFAGRVLLVVNVASKCGLTPQYAGLQSLYAARKAEGLDVLGFPANDFKGQEPGSNEEIAGFCSLTYDVSFPMFAKVVATGADRHPLYSALIAAQPESIGEGPMRDKLKGFGVDPADRTEVLWNFEKFLIGRDGQVLARFAPDVTADDPRVVAAIDAALR